MKISKALRSNRDLPQIVGEQFSLAALGSGGDYEHAVVTLPNLGQGSSAGTAGMTAQNAMTIRWVTLVFEGIVTGAATNTFSINILQRRAGLFLVNTTAPTTIVAGSMAVSPVSMNNIVPGSRLVVSAGVGAAETVVVQSVTATNFTANFQNGHSGAYTLVSAPIASLPFLAGVNAVAYSPIQLAPAANNVILPGDAVTIQRLTLGTGIATPAVSVGIEWVCSGAQ